MSKTLCTLRHGMLGGGPSIGVRVHVTIFFHKQIAQSGFSQHSRSTEGQTADGIVTGNKVKTVCLPHILVEDEGNGFQLGTAVNIYIPNKQSRTADKRRYFRTGARYKLITELQILLCVSDQDGSFGSKYISERTDDSWNKTELNKQGMQHACWGDGRDKRF